MHLPGSTLDIETVKSLQENSAEASDNGHSLPVETSSNGAIQGVSRVLSSAILDEADQPTRLCHWDI